MPWVFLLVFAQGRPASRVCRASIDLTVASCYWKSVRREACKGAGTRWRGKAVVSLTSAALAGTLAVPAAAGATTPASCGTDPGKQGRFRRPADRPARIGARLGHTILARGARRQTSFAATP